MISQAEIYAFNFAKDEPAFYTMIPNIIDHLSYIDEQGKSIRLSIYAKELYRIIRMTASNDGKTGKCWRSTENLSVLMNCSVGSVVNAKKELLMKFEQLDNQSLIIEDKRVKAKVVDGKILNKSVYCTYTLVNIWKWNNGYMSIQKSLNESRAHSPYESAPPPDSPHESAPEEAHSPGECNKNKEKKNPLFREQQPAANAAHVAFLENNGLSEVCQAVAWLVKLGFKDSPAKLICQKYPIRDIGAASVYLGEQIEKKKHKGEIIPNKPAYFQTILKFRYWEKKK